MKNQEKILNTAFKMCNYISIFTSVIMIISALVFGGVSAFHLSTSETVEGTILEIKGDNCYKNILEDEGREQFDSEYCFLRIGYNKKNTDYSSNSEESFVNASDTDENYDYDYINTLRINNASDYNVGDKIMIDYNTKIPTNISLHVNYVLYLVVSFTMLFLSILNIYVRTALYENETVQQFLMLTCFRS